MALLTKMIKPKKLNDQVYRLEFLRVVRKTGRDIKKEYQETIATWNTRPKFEVLFQLSKGEITVYVGTNSEIYGYVNDGTERHDIFPSEGKLLIFNTGYAAKTVPNIIGSGSGGPFGGTVGSEGVDHPGNKARNFTKTILAKYEPIFKQRIDKAISIANKKSGHSFK